MNHVQLGCVDAERSAQFYEKYFGFRKAFAEDDLLFLRDAGGFLLTLRSLDAPASFPTWFHVGFMLPDPESAKRMHARMKEDGVPLKGDLYQDEARVAFYCYGPGGYTVEVGWDRPEGDGE